MRYLLPVALAFSLSLTANAQQSTLGRLSTGSMGTSNIFLTPDSGDISAIISSNKPAGTRYILAPGVYNCFNTMEAPTNGGISGSGWTTLLRNFSTNGTGFQQPFIMPCDGSVVESLQITNVNDDAGETPQYLQTCWGRLDKGVAVPATIRNCFLFTGTDAIFFNESVSPINVYIDSCTITSKWDGIVFQNAANSKVTIRNTIVAAGIGTHIGKALTFITATGTKASIYNSQFIGSSVSGTGPCVNLFDLSQPDLNFALFAYNTVFTNGTLPWVDVSLQGGHLEFWNCPRMGYDKIAQDTSDGLFTATVTPALLDTKTNWISGQFYTNVYGAPMYVNAGATNVSASIAGTSTVELWCFSQPVSASGFTNKSGNGTIVGTLATTNNLAQLEGVIPAGFTFTFTNRSGGAGNAANIYGGHFSVP